MELINVENKAFPNSQTTSNTPSEIISFEAEELTLTGGYRSEKGDYAFGGKFIGLHSSRGSTGTAILESFPGESGAYNIEVKYFDEGDGISPFFLNIQNQRIVNWSADQKLGSNTASAKSLTEIVLQNIPVNKSEKIEIGGAIEGGENARIDRIKFIPSGDNIPPSPALTVSNLTVTSGDAEGLTFTVTYTDNLGIDSSTIDSEDVRIIDPSGLPLDSTLISTELSPNGKIATATYTLEPPGGSWNLSDSGTYSFLMQQDQVFDVQKNPVANSPLGIFPIVVNSNGEIADYSQSPQGIHVNLKLGVGYLPNSTLPIKIMPLGDSITAGKEDDRQPEKAREGYRIGLWQRFASLGVPIDFVGSESNGTPNLPDTDHEGHPSWTINDLKGGKKDVVGSGVDNWIPAFSPEVILLMIGTNDASNSASTMGDRLSDLIDTIINNPSFDNGNLLVSTIAPIHPQSEFYTPRMQNVKDYNALIPEIVASKPELEKVKFVNTWKGSNAIQEGDITPPPDDNGLHPTKTGYQKLANYWFHAILDATGKKDNLPDKNSVLGSAYNDVLVGNAATNTLQGGGGNDQLRGGGGADIFIYNNPNQGLDTLTDFNPTQGDIFGIFASGFGAGLVAGTPLSTTSSSTGVFVSGTTSNYLGDMAHFFYDTTTGLLSFDPDGSQAQPPIPLVILTGQPALNANQLMII